MATISRTAAHKTLVTQHNSLYFESDLARISIRKECGRFRVILEDKYYGKVTKQDFATMNGALISAEMLKEGYL